ncbi:hypothetical protein OROMI_031290 [Orobanche minor]
MRGEAEKFMPLVREMMDSGLRHTRARGIDVSLWRQRNMERMGDFGDDDIEFDSSAFYTHVRTMIRTCTRVMVTPRLLCVGSERGEVGDLSLMGRAVVNDVGPRLT